jgi:hypothetical protein
MTMREYFHQLRQSEKERKEERSQAIGDIYQEYRNKEEFEKRLDKKKKDS